MSVYPSDNRLSCFLITPTVTLTLKSTLYNLHSREWNNLIIILFNLHMIFALRIVSILRSSNNYA